jgi:energy-coupling factor transporter ATP-binding protein EcfA2
MTAAIETEALTRRFGAIGPSTRVSMTVPDRAVYGFLGRNGAGKTTTLKMLLGLIRPTSGRRGSRRRCGPRPDRGRAQGRGPAGGARLLRQSDGAREPRPDPHPAGRAGDRGRPGAGGGRDADNGERRVSDYSLGMRQRLGLARAMLGAPPVLVLDEPTNGLDPDGIADMRRFLRDLPARTGPPSCCPATCWARSSRPPPISASSTKGGWCWKAICRG